MDAVASIFESPFDQSQDVLVGHGYPVHFFLRILGDCARSSQEYPLYVLLRVMRVQLTRYLINTKNSGTRGKWSLDTQGVSSRDDNIFSGGPEIPALPQIW